MRRRARKVGPTGDVRIFRGRWNGRRTVVDVGQFCGRSSVKVEEEKDSQLKKEEETQLTTHPSMILHRRRPRHDCIVDLIAVRGGDVAEA